MIHPRIATAILALMLSPAARGMADKAYEYTIPEKINDGWETVSLASANLHAEALKAMVDRIANGTFKNIHSVLIVKDDKLVFEEYFPREIGDRREQALKRVAPAPQYSVTKSVTSILIGIAIDQHKIRGVDEKISTFFPEYADLLAQPDRDKLRLKDLLTMSAGLSWDEWTHPYGMVAVFTGWNDNALLFQPMDMVQEFLMPAALPVAPVPPAKPKEVQARIRAILQEQRGANHIPGLAFVAVENDKVLFFESIGLRDVDAKVPVTPDTVFPVGSCTKSFTAIAAGISHDQGMLSLDDSPHKWSSSPRSAGHPWRCSCRPGHR